MKIIYNLLFALLFFFFLTEIPALLSRRRKSHFLPQNYFTSTTPLPDQLPDNFTRSLARNPKFMSYLPSIVKVIIPPEACGNGNDGVRDGVCLPRGKCQVQKGTPNGDCAKGFGECCRFQQWCNSSNTDVQVTREVVQLTSNGGSTDRDCVFEIRRKPKYCQIRVDFVDYVSQPADFNGNCVRESFSVRGSSTVSNGYQVCGTLSKQHMYLAFGKSETIELRPSFENNGGNYKIVVTQIPCISSLRVPDWCLQYYNTTKGTVKSFAFGTQHLANQKYSICIGGINSATSINWRRCANPGVGTPAFSIASPPPSIDTREAPCSRDQDWIQFNGESRLCSFPENSNGITSNYTPFLLNVHFNSYEKPNYPFLEDISKFKEDECKDNAGNNPDKLYWGCHWQAQQGEIRAQCICYPKPELESLYGPPDFNNTGFCLDYTQS